MNKIKEDQFREGFVDEYFSIEKGVLEEHKIAKYIIYYL